MILELRKLIDFTYRQVLKLKRRQQPRYGFVKDVDLEGTAEWNPRGLKPAVRVWIQDAGQIESVACRIATPWAKDDAGIWWRPEIGQAVLLNFQQEIDSPVVVGYIWNGKTVRLPVESTKDNVVFKFGKHTIIFDESTIDGGLTLITEHGIQVSMSDNVSGEREFVISHPSGTYLVLDKNGNWTTYVKGNKTETIKGTLTIAVDGNVSISGLKITLDSQTLIELKTLMPLAGILTALTQPVCPLSGIPMGVADNLLGGA